MGPGGYRLIDDVKGGLPLTLVIGVVSMGALPIFLPMIP